MDLFLSIVHQFYYSYCLLLLSFSSLLLSTLCVVPSASCQLITRAYKHQLITRVLITHHQSSRLYFPRFNCAQSNTFSLTPNQSSQALLQTPQHGPGAQPSSHLQASSPQVFILENIHLPV